MNKLKLWNAHTSWDEAEKVWDEGAHAAAASKPLKRLKTLPDIPGITPETAQNLKWKSFKYMLFHKEGKAILKNVFKHPLRYGIRYLRSLCKKNAYRREADFFYYGLKNQEEFEQLVQKESSLLVVGFSYCQKPHECPSGRFTPECLSDANHPVCRQCDIGKVLHALPNRNVIPLLIPTVHYIGLQLFDIVHRNPTKQIVFLITACEMTLEMFSDWGNMIGIKGIGVRLDGRICNTMKAFELSEDGIKPGLTIVTSSTQEKILSLMKSLREKE